MNDIICCHISLIYTLVWMWRWRHILPATWNLFFKLINCQIPTSRSLLLPDLPDDLHQVDPRDKRFLLGKQKRICINLFVCSYKFPPFIICNMFVIRLPWISSYLHNWHDRRFLWRCKRHRGFFCFGRRVAAGSQDYEGFYKRPRGVTTAPPLFRPLLAEVDQSFALDPGLWSCGIYDGL